MRVIIYTGKGGVGKTSVAAATALRSAALGNRTAIISTDAAHSLGDSLEMQLSGKMTNVAKNLDAIEVDMQYELETRWKEIQTYLADFLASQGMDDVTAKEMAVFPGMELMSALFYIEEWHKEKKYEVVVMDTAPTADTLRLLAFPDTANWYFDRLFHMLRNVIRVARATVGKLMTTPLPTEKFLEDLESLKTRLARVHDILTDPEITSIRLVVNPEKMVITETQRAYTYLCLYGYTVESIVINRVIPEELSKGYFNDKLIEQKKYLKMIDEVFSPLKTFRAKMMPREVLGTKALALLADELFAGEDPTKVFSKESPMKMYSEENAEVLALKLPFPMDQKLELYTRKDDLTVQLGPFKKSIALPYSMTNKKILGAEMDDGWLVIRFEGEPHAKEKGRKRTRGRKEARKAR
ncbi:MAG: ArsA family ATPase [Thermoplasmata archaeon]|jgi:arsenite-transporting ATPase|nr:ArsA family ATPase [Thermoplasmata archaeon]